MITQSWKVPLLFGKEISTQIREILIFVVTQIYQTLLLLLTFGLLTIYRLSNLELDLYNLKMH